MASLKPFRGLRPPKEIAPRLAAPPYDVVNSEEARAYAQGNEQSFFRISRPEVDLPPSIDEHSDHVYRRGLDNLREFLAKQWLRRDERPSFYVYRQVMGAHAQVGVVAAASVEEYDRSLIKKHELTRQDKEDDRTKHLEVLGGNDEPVFLTFRAEQAIDALVEGVTRTEPEYDFAASDGVAHTFWVVRGEANRQLEQAFDHVPCLYIADGHHRSAAASRVLAHRRAQRLPIAEHGRFLAVVFPHDQMQILPYNRVVKDLHGLSPEQLLQRLEPAFSISPTEHKAPGQLHSFGMYVGRRWYQLTAREGSFSRTPTGVLDVSILQQNVLGPILGIADPRADQRIHFVGGIRGTAELERLVDGGGYQVAFSMFPTSLEQLMAIADAGEIMPPKSTWFEPKLRSGLVLHPFE